MADAFAGYTKGLTSPATVGFAITPDDETDLADIPRELYIGTGGDITVDFVDGGEEITLTNVPDGARLPYRVSRVYDTGTTASDIVGVR